MNNDGTDVRPPDDAGTMRDTAASGRRSYVAPVLVEYGTVAKLTQTGGGSITDFGAMMRMACL